MAGPSLEYWISDLGLQQVDDPDVDKPVYRKPFDGRVTLSAELEAQISSRVREARDKRNLPRSKLAPLLGLSEGVTPATKTTFPVLRRVGWSTSARSGALLRKRFLRR